MDVPIRRKAWLALAGLLATVMLAFAFVPSGTAFAEGDNIAQGTCGECTWTIDADGVLTIEPTNGVSGTLGEPLSISEPGNGTTVGEGTWPWSDYAWSTDHNSEISSVVIKPGVTAGKSLNGAFARLTSCEFDLSGLDTSNTTDMSWMFLGSSTKSGTTATLNFNTSKVTHMEGMFS